MAYQYIFDPVAADEYEEAFKWYEQKSVIAADNLISAIQDAIIAICTNPYRYRNTHKNLRELTLKKYHYNLIYFIDENKKLITITSLYHHKQNPEANMINQKRKSEYQMRIFYCKEFLFGSYAELRAVAEVYRNSDAKEKFVKRFYCCLE
jgi:plasmid stabilization system protein ParE